MITRIKIIIYLSRGDVVNKLPFHIDLNEVEILKELNTANHHIGELKGILKILPNPGIVLSLINLSESKDSSAIEDIITTYDEIFKVIVSKTPIGGKPKEVINYKHAMDRGLLVMRQKGFISTNILVEIQNVIEPNKGGIRKLPGTVIINDKTNEVVHTPPQNETFCEYFSFKRYGSMFFASACIGCITSTPSSIRSGIIASTEPHEWCITLSP